MKENAKINEGEVVSPQKIEEMDDEAFDSYIESAKKEGEEVDDAQPSGEAEPAENVEGKPYISFKTKEELQEYQDMTIGKRLKEIRESKNRATENLAEISELAKKKFNITNDRDALSMLIEELERQNAGETKEEYNFKKQLEYLKNEASYQQRVENIQNDWLSQSEVLKKIVPDFDLDEAFKNSNFYKKVVIEHQSILEAYPVLKKKPVRRAISEIGNLTNGVSGSIRHDVASMSDREFDDYIKKIKNS